ncbi:MAG TPA: hypothetical protein PKN80_02840, partial [bacterium]|nr:hypothetical protein [bacterium]
NAEVLGDADVPSTGSITGETYITGQKDYDADVKTPNPVVIPPALIALPYPVTGDPRISEATVAAGVLTVANNKTATLAAGNYHFKGINVRNNAILRMEGSVIIYVEQDITLNQGASLRLGQPTYSMVFYVGPDGIIDLEQNSAVNIPLTTRPTQARFYVAGTGTEIITSVLSAQVAIFNGLIYAPERRATIEENVDFYGGLVVRELSIDNNASIHYDASLREPPGFPEDPGTVIPAGLKLLNWTKPGWRERLL